MSQIHDGVIKNKIEPLLYEYEYNKGKEFKLIMESQYNAIKFVRDFNKVSQGVIGISPKEAFKNISKIGINPSNKDINAFKDFYLYDGNKIKL